MTQENPDQNRGKEYRLEFFHQAFLDSGLVKCIKPLRHDRGRDRYLVKIVGKPVSQTIIEDRR